MWLQSSSRRTAMAGSGWSLPSPPLCSHTSAAVTAAVTVTGSPGRNHSGLSAGEGESMDAEAVHSRSSSSSSYPAASSAIPAWEQTVVDEGENTPMKLYQLPVNIAVPTKYGRMDATVFNLSSFPQQFRKTPRLKKYKSKKKERKKKKRSTVCCIAVSYAILTAEYYITIFNIITRILQCTVITYRGIITFDKIIRPTYFKKYMSVVYLAAERGLFHCPIFSVYTNTLKHWFCFGVNWFIRNWTILQR